MTVDASRITTTVARHQHPTTSPRSRVNPNLTSQERRLLDNAKRHRQTIRDALQDLDETILNDLARRHQHAATDAYTGGEGGRGNDISDPTLSNILRAANPAGEGVDTWPTTPDHVRAAITDIFAQLAEAAGILTLVDKKRAYVYAIADKAAGRKPNLGGSCERCAKNVTGAVGDKLVSGYCGACRKAWERAGYPDRHQFEQTYEAAS